MDDGIHLEDVQKATGPADAGTETIKIPCQCGQEYSFDLRPEANGEIVVSFTFRCPRCGTTSQWSR